MIGAIIGDIIGSIYEFSVGRTFVIYKKNKDRNKYEVKYHTFELFDGKINNINSCD